MRREGARGSSVAEEDDEVEDEGVDAEAAAGAEPELCGVDGDEEDAACRSISRAGGLWAQAIWCSGLLRPASATAKGFQNKTSPACMQHKKSGYCTQKGEKMLSMPFDRD